MKIGLIAGRHPLPVDVYIINKEIPQEFLSVEGFPQLKELIEEEVNNFLIEFTSDDGESLVDDTIELYLTGLSRVQHIVIDMLKKYFRVIRLMDYDKSNDLYFCFMEVKK